MRLLFVDDDPMFLRIWAREGERRPELTVVGVASMAAARDALSEGAFDAVFCDWRMGEETSARFVQALLARGQKVIVLTAATHEAEAALGRQVPMFEKMRITFDELVAVAGASIA